MAQKDIVDVLMQTPKKDKGLAMPHFEPLYPPNLFQMADLLHMPTDDDYKYALCIVNVGIPRLVQAEPIKTKDSKAVIEAFEAIYKRKLLKYPKTLIVDAGSEFKGDVAKYLIKKGVKITTALPARHRQLGIIDRAIQKIGTELHTRMNKEEFLTGEQSNQWTEFLPKTLQKINIEAKIQKKPKPITSKDDPIIQNPIISLGTKVRTILDAPRDYLTGKRLQGSFRKSDMRFDAKAKVVTNILLKPGSVPLYKVAETKDSKEVGAAYTFNQLKIVNPNEKAPDRSNILPKKNNKYIAEKIVANKTIGKKKYYEVKWKAFPSSENTLEPYDQIIEDQGEMVLAYEKSKNKRLSKLNLAK